MNNHYISDRFRKEIFLHVIKNIIPTLSEGAPLILGVHGPSGEGKTFQCHKILNEIGVKIFLISGGQLESYQAGQPAELIRKVYIDASKSIEKKECFASVVLFNDIDTGIGNWGEKVQYTINRQTVLGEIMHIVDYPTLVEGRKTNRIPIIMTGNDFTKLYSPLVRAGRMHSFEWKPLFEEKILMVKYIFPEFNDIQIKEMISTLIESDKKNTLSIAFFSQLRSIVSNDLLWDVICSEGSSIFINKIQNGVIPVIKGTLNYDDVLSAAFQLLSNCNLINHL